VQIGSWLEGEVGDAGSDEESEVGLEGRTGGCEFRRESEFSPKVKLEDWSSGESRKPV
jgi:hypothetical protein